ncbi:MAG: Gfo/Idh/MocA family oxidoreductase [Candidatus Pacebacteria bacterium]|nr:Gfo/Idh/MocA family oxidoreductase [Candidatus Paceibacterota bacterium]
MKTALIGYGYWGEKIYDNLLRHVKKEDIIIVDIKNSDIKLETVLNNAKITHCFIATPELTHFEIANKCLNNNKNIFVEKPLCLKKNEAKKLIKIAKTKNLSIHVDYIFLYDQTLIKIKKMIEDGVIGSLQHIESIRHSVNITKPGSTVIDDLAIHDIYIGRYFFNKKISSIDKHLLSINSHQKNQANITYYYNEKSLSASYSWIQPQANRVLTFIGDLGSIVWDKNIKKIMIFKDQTLIKKANIPVEKSALETSITKFLYNDINDSSYQNYVNDVEIIESINTNMIKNL